jgi:hypothetical protein
VAAAAFCAKANSFTDKMLPGRRRQHWNQAFVRRQDHSIGQNGALASFLAGVQNHHTPYAISRLCAGRAMQ